MISPLNINLDYENNKKFLELLGVEYTKGSLEIIKVNEIAPN